MDQTQNQFVDINEMVKDTEGKTITGVSYLVGMLYKRFRLDVVMYLQEEINAAMLIERQNMIDWMHKDPSVENPNELYNEKYF